MFSFIFYSSVDTADRIYHQIKNNELLQWLKTEQTIIWTGFDDIANNRRPDITKSGDAKWPDEIKKTWPNFIMGASQMWLDLVTEYASQLDADEEPLIRYQQVQIRMTEVWRDHGQHA